jgi:hypothetical protein
MLNRISAILYIFLVLHENTKCRAGDAGKKSEVISLAFREVDGLCKFISSSPSPNKAIVSEKINLIVASVSQSEECLYRVALICFSCAYPESAEDANVDVYFDECMWKCIYKLAEHQTKTAVAKLREMQTLIGVDAGNHLRFRDILKNRSGDVVEKSK